MNKVRVNITNAVINAPTYAGVTFSPSMINFFYGKNGTGKSTLAKAFTDGSAALTWKGDPYPTKRMSGATETSLVYSPSPKSTPRRRNLPTKKQVKKLRLMLKPMLRVLPEIK